MKCKQCKGFGKVVGQFPEDEFDDEGRFLGWDRKIKKATRGRVDSVEARVLFYVPMHG